MRYIEPPTKRNPKYSPPPPKKPREYKWLRLVIGLGALFVIYLLSQFVE
jgi:hypothetical protein